MPTDFRDGKTFPRRGREPLGEFLWLARVFDKARAEQNHTQDGYIYPCPIDRGVMRRWGISPSDFSTALADHTVDDQILAWMSARVAPERIRAANAWLRWLNIALDWQDVEEGVPGAGLRLWKELGLAVFVAALVVLFEWFLRR